MIALYVLVGDWAIVFLYVSDWAIVFRMSVWAIVLLRAYLLGDRVLIY